MRLSRVPHHKNPTTPLHPTTNPAPPEFPRPARPSDLTPTLRKLLTGSSLTADETTAAFEAIMTGDAHHAEIGALLALLATRTPTADEILGAARVMRSRVDRVESAHPPEAILDTAGTGGAPKTFNVSTAAAIIAASAGAVVAKHGNRSRTGRGSAEVLQTLGVNINADRATQSRCLNELNICFCFAIHHHPAARHAMPVRQALGFPTIFNLLGPLTNPAGARRQLMGVYEKRFLLPIANALRDLGAVRALVVHSEDGLDELSIAAPTHIALVENGNVSELTITPSMLNLETASLDHVQARDLDHAAAMIRSILDGSLHGPPRDMAVLNAAAALFAAGKAETLEQAATLATEALNTNRAHQTLTQLAKLSNQPPEP